MYVGPSWSPERAYDAQLWNESTLRDAVITNSIDIPQPLPDDDRPIPYFSPEIICSQRVGDKTVPAATPMGLHLSPFSRQTMR